MRFEEIGEQLRTYRLESGLKADEIAARLGISRAALYRYEKGEVIKLDTVRRLAEMLQVSPLALLGIGVDYFSRINAFLERQRQIEEAADSQLQLGGALCFALTSAGFDQTLRGLWLEAAGMAADRAAALSLADQSLASLAQRRFLLEQRRPSITLLLSETALLRLLTEGIGAGLPLSERGRAQAKAAAVTEAEHLANLMEQAPLGVQIGLLQEPDPSHQAIIYRARDRAHVIANPFPPDAHPSWHIGIASVTSADDALAIHQRVAEACWRQARKGAAAAQWLRMLIMETRSA
ncbi:MAG: helix-turn-helix transcriptional regulator [Roseomonas sp.]|jgi:transcriptional regulator with XRE-family HTH domain|nr:helix-turn-helix transcriptional regulator [Roseomonas sp.]MCA3431108.1 helix-turn-helix transcriptional regulator [Roseomonas sp.]MCA3434544.1 helix-turn-helix transcriptional regulator [Roseomonas sp.]